MQKLTIFAMLLLASCDQPNSKICGTITEYSEGGGTAKDWVGQGQIAGYCVEKLAARLSRGTDTATETAQAAVAACHGQIVVANDLREKASVPQEDEKYWLGRALFIVVQARAGHCYRDV